MIRTDYLYFGPLCLLVDTDIGWKVKLGAYASLSPPCLDLYVWWWLFSFTSAAHGRECQGYEDEQREIARECVA